MSHIEIRDADTEDRRWIDAQYGPIDFRLTRDGDTHVVALINGERVGAGRIVSVEHGVGELGGVYTLPSHRGHGIARMVVQALLDRMTQTELYCLPYLHLEQFYEQFGFARVTKMEITCKYVREKLEWCKDTYETEVIAQILVDDRE